MAKAQLTAETALFLVHAYLALDKPAEAMKLLEDLAKDPNLTPERRKAIEKLLADIKQK